MSLNAQCDTQCTFSFKLTDAIGDGWNGNSMTVVQGSTSYDMTLDASTGFFQYTYNLPLCADEPFEVIWNPGGAYPQEVILEIQNPTGQVIYSLPPGNRFQDSTIFSGTATCTVETCVQPANLKFTSIAIDNPTLIWTNVGGAATWEVLVLPSGTTPGPGDVGIITSTPSFTYAGLVAGVDYIFYVRTVCESSSSNWVSIPLRCPKPFNIVYVTESRYYDFYTTWGSDFSSTFETLLQSASEPEPTEATSGSLTTLQQYKTDGLVEGLYHFYLRSRCSEDMVSDWYGPMVFDVACGQPTAPQMNGNEISWTPTGGATQWEVYITDEPFLPSLTTTGTLTTENPYIADNLTEGVTYYVYIRSVCTDGITSVWSQQRVFVYEPLSTNDPSAWSATVFPNPAEGTLRITAGEQMDSMRISDITGKVVLTKNLDGVRETAMDVSMLQSGSYFVHLMAENGLHKTIRIVKK